MERPGPGESAVVGEEEHERGGLPAPSSPAAPFSADSVSLLLVAPQAMVGGAASLEGLEEGEPVERVEARWRRRRGSAPLRLPPRMEVRAVLGNVELDLREAVLAGDVDVHAEAVLGAVTVSAVLGSVEVVEPSALR